jgi:hypothetical protein
MMEAVRTSETSVDNNFTRQYIPEDNSEHLSPASLLGASAGICQKTLLERSVIIRTQVETHGRSENGRAAWNALYDATP